MTPHTTNTDICRIRFAITRTKPMESMEPAKAAMIMVAEPIKSPFPRNRIMTSATTSWAPEEMPRTNGPAMGFAKNVWSRKPDTESAPPSNAAARSLGKRMSHRIWYAVLSRSVPDKIACMSWRDRETLPTRKLAAARTASKNPSSKNPS